MTQRISSTSNWYSPQIPYYYFNMAIVQSSDNGSSSKQSETIFTTSLTNILA
jgi:hypothetical protein